VLAEEPVVLSNIPRISDVDTMVALLRDIGAEVEWTAPNEARVDASGAHRTDLDPALCSQMRASFLLAGPLLARFGRATVPPPGGDVIGRRRLDPHLHAFAELGAAVEVGSRYEMSTHGLRGTQIFLDEASVMATENAVMAAVLTPGETVIGNAACEPHVQDLCRFLVSLGARIEGIESNVLRIEGVRSLRGGEWRIGPDHIEVASFIGLAAVTGGEVTIEGVAAKDLVPILPSFARLGVRVEIDGPSVRVSADQELAVLDDVGGYIPKIEDGPWPAFPSDLTSIVATVATQARGTVLIFEKMFESRLFFTDKLVSMGARIILCDPHRVVITGPSKLRGQRMESPDIRAGMAMLLASLCADGASTIGAVYQFDKGYERIDERLRELGAQIERVDV
jgi:UDP-N-acetylglucosamine 1-carboxyvinyltransferase